MGKQCCISTNTWHVYGVSTATPTIFASIDSEYLGDNGSGRVSHPATQAVDDLMRERSTTSLRTFQSPVSGIVISG